MITSLIELDRRVFLALNNLHAPWLDPVMYWISDTLVWLPLYALLLFYLSKLPRAHLIIALLCLAIGITLSDQIASTLLKPLIGRLRPTWDAAISAQVHTVYGYRGGQFGFPSSHSANTFCTAVLLTCVLRARWLYSLFLWAALVSFSRVYLGVHYPGDILVGAAIGCLCGLIVFRLYKFACKRIDN